MVKPLDGTPIIYDNGVPMPNTETAGDYLYGGSFNTYPLNNDATYLGGQVGMPRLAKGLGTGTNANPLASGSTYYGRYQGQIVIGAALHGVPMVISPSGLWGTIKELADNTTIQGGFWTVAQLQYGNNNLNSQGGSQTAGSLTSRARTYFKGQLAELGLWAKALSVEEAMTIGQKNWGV